MYELNYLFSQQTQKINNWHLWRAFPLPPQNQTIAKSVGCKHSFILTKCKFNSSVSEESNFPEEDFASVNLTTFAFTFPSVPFWQTGLNRCWGRPFVKQAVGPVKAAEAC